MTISEFTEALPKRGREILIYNALGEALTNELNNAGCELTIADDLKHYSFSNLTPELQEKINAKKFKLS